MSKRKMFLIISAVIFLASAFIISFNWGMNRFGENSKKPDTVNQAGIDPDKVASALKTEETVSPNAKVTIKIQYIKSSNIVQKEAETSEFAGKTRKELESSYVIESFTPTSVVLIKKVDSYEPNKYVIGIKDQYLAIYKTDDKGNMYIENEESDVTEIKVPTKGDYDRLVKGDKYFQFDSREEAEALLGEYSS